MKFMNSLKNNIYTCPECGELIEVGYTAYGENDRYGRTTMTYSGWCSTCQKGYEVQRFQKNEFWLTHKYRTYITVKDHAVPQSWVEVYPLPEPPVCVLGPGGSYDKAVEGTELCLIESAIESIKHLSHTLQILLDLKKDKYNKHGHKDS
jgi:hypothetical protein